MKNTQSFPLRQREVDCPGWNIDWQVVKLSRLGKVQLHLIMTMPLQIGTLRH